MESFRLLREVIGDHSRIDLRGEDDRRHLRLLRSKLSALRRGYPEGEAVPVSELTKIEVPSPVGTLKVRLDSSIENDVLVSQAEIQSLLNAIDEYLLSQLRHLTRYEIGTHRGIVFLVSRGEGVRAPVFDQDDIKKRIDAAGGAIPGMVLAEVSREVYESEICRPYPFRFIAPLCRRRR